jgi:hypothetical protein
VVGRGEGGGGVGIRFKAQADAFVVALQVQPNPSDGHAVVSVKIPEGVEHATIKVWDPIGRLVAEKPIAGGQPLVDLPTLQVSGLYVAVLYLDGVLAQTEKFQVVR